MNKKQAYIAVDRDTLRRQLGGQCSPDYRSAFTKYVIGPDINGRLCHCSTHIGGWACARKKAQELNEVGDDE